MASRMKEEEKNEKIIRGLLKHPANKRCINCNSLGPQYVCTNFWTFICTNCSGLHREFTHRVKSISMAKFTSQEVIALQEGGNERARQIFFKEWDPQLHSFPDSSHLDRLRDFIKQAYVDRRYAGGKHIDDIAKAKGDRDDYDERSNSDHRGSRSSPYSDLYESRSPPHTESALKSYENRVSDVLPIPGVSDRQKSVYISSPPMVRPVREILDGDVPQLWVGEPPKMNGAKSSNSSLEKQSSVSSSKGFIDGSNAGLKRVSSASLIDFSADPEPVAAGVAHDSFHRKTTSNVPASDKGGWASFDVSSQETGDLESMFSQLSVGNPAISSAASIDSIFQSSLSSLTAQPTGPPFLETAQPTGPPFPATVQPTGLSFTVTVQPTASPFPATLQPTGQPYAATVPGAVNYSHNLIETKTVGRKELPLDLFTGLYQSPASNPGWRIGPGHGVVYGMQYPVMMQPTTMPRNISPSLNPFDLANEPEPSPNPMHHPSASLQGTLPNVNTLPFLPNSSNLAAVPSQWTPQQFSYPSSSSIGPYMVQQFSHDIPHQVPGSFFPVMNQSAAAGSEAATPYGARSPHNSSIRGNPFG